MLLYWDPKKGLYTVQANFLFESLPNKDTGATSSLQYLLENLRNKKTGENLNNFM